MPGSERTPVTGQTIVLLGARGAGKSQLLAGIARRDRDALGVLGLQLEERDAVGYCGHRALAHGHLTAKQNLQVAAALGGVDDWPESAMSLVRALPGSEGRAPPAALLPREEVCLLTLAMALLCNPNLLVVDDLGRGLSQPAQHALWRRLRALQLHEPRMMIYASSDLQTAGFLGAETWVIDGGRVRARWAAGDLPPQLAGLEASAYTMKRREDAAKLLDVAKSLNALYCAVRTDGVTVDVLAHADQFSMLEMATAGGAALAHFSALRPDVSLLAEGWHQSGERDERGNGQQPVLHVRRAGAKEGHTESSSLLRAVALVAWSEWRRTFRDATRVVWPMGVSVLLLALMAIAAAGGSQGPWQYRWLLQGAAAAPALLFGYGTGRYWFHTVEMETLYHAARRDKGRGRMTLADLFARPGRQQYTLWWGMTLGAWAMGLAHGALFQLSWLAAVVQMGGNGGRALAVVAAGCLLALLAAGAGVWAGAGTRGRRD